MTKKVQARMSTEVALDVLKASESLSSLKQVVNSTTKAWQAQSKQMASAGDYITAAQRKYEGLGKSIKAQETYIESLKSKQSELSGNTEKTAKEYLKFQKNIDSATTRLKSMEAQQNKAKESMSYYTSGLGALQKGYKQAEAYSKSYVERLNAEGRSAEANKIKLSSLDSGYKNLNNQMKAQVKQLSELNTAENRDSDAINKQKIRINETATAMAKAKTETSELKAEIAKNTPATWAERFKKSVLGINPATVQASSGLNNVNRSIEKTGKEAEVSNKRFSILKGTMLGSFAGNTIYSGIARIGSGLKESAKDGLELAEQGEQTQRVWKELGAGSSGAEKLSKQMVDLRAKTGYAAGDIKKVQKGFYGLTDSVPATQKLTSAMTGIGVASGLSGEKVASMTRMVSRLSSSSTVTTSLLGRMETQAPKMGDALAKAAGTSRKGFDSMVEGGKLSGKEFQGLMEKVSKQSPEAFKEFGKTGAGAMAQIKGNWTSLKSNMMTPLVTVKGSGLSEVSKAMGGKEMQDASKQLGKGISNVAKSFANMLGYAAKHSKDIFGIAGGIGSIAKALGVGVWKAVTVPIKLIADGFNEISGNSKKAKDPLKSVNGAIGGIAKHQKAIEIIGGALIGAFAGKKLLSGVGTLVTGFGNLGKALSAKSFADLKNLGKFTKGIGNIKLGAKWLGAKAVAAAKLAYSGLTKTLKLTGKGFKALGLAMKANPFITITVAVIAIGTALFELYKHNKKFRNFVNGLLSEAKKALGPVIKFFTNLGKTVGKVFGGIGNFAKKGWNGVKKASDNGIKNDKKAWNNFNKNTSKAASSMWKSTKSAFSKGWNNIKSATNTGSKNVQKVWSNLKNGTGNIAKQMMKDHPRTFKSGYKVMQDYSNTWKDVTGGHWDRLGKDTKKTTQDMTKFWKNVMGDAYNWLNKMTGGRLGDMLKTFQNIGKSISKTWSDLWNGVKQTFSDIWDSIKQLGKDGMNGVIGFINGGIGGIDTVIHTFGGKANAVPKISKLAAGTQNGRLTEDTLAVLNDGHDSPQTKNRELVEKKDGSMYLVKGVNTLAKLEAGDAVYNAKQTSKMLKGLLPHFGLGSGIANAVSGAVDWAGDKLGDVGKFLGDKFKAIEKFFKNPVKELSNVFDKAVGSLSGKAELITDMVPPAGHYIIKQGEKWFKDLFKGLRGSMENPGGAGTERWRSIIQAVADRMGVSLTSAGMAAVLHRIAQESNGSATVTNNWDSNAKAGHPSTGLLQYIQPTFDHWLPKGFTNDIHNGSSQIAAMFNDSNWLRDISVKGGWGPTGHKKMANGGIIGQHQMIEIAENNKKEAVIPMDAMKSSRAWTLLKKVIDNFADGSGSSSATAATSGSDLDSKVVELTSVVNSMATMMKTIIGLNADQITATKGIGTFDQKENYKQQARDLSTQQWTAL